MTPHIHFLSSHAAAPPSAPTLCSIVFLGHTPLARPHTQAPRRAEARKKRSKPCPPLRPSAEENIDAADLLEVRARARNMDWGARAVVCSCPSAAPRLLPRLPPSQPRLFFFFHPHRCTPCRAPVIAWPLTEASSLVRTCSRLCPVGRRRTTSSRNSSSRNGPPRRRTCRTRPCGRMAGRMMRMTATSPRSFVRSSRRRVSSRCRPRPVGRRRLRWSSREFLLSACVWRVGSSSCACRLCARSRILTLTRSSLSAFARAPHRR